MRPWIPAAVQPLGVAVLSLVLAGFARYRLVEPADLTATCDAAPWQGAVCVLRSLTVQAFAAQRLGGVALALGLLALLTRWRVAAVLALAAGGAGLVLYSTTLAAPAVLLAGLALVRRRTGVGSGAGAAR